MIKIDKLNPFGKMCLSMGMIPSSYKESLTYEEQLLWFCNFLENEVIPAVNQEGEAIEELQQLFLQLREYVDTYFDNLDIQSEVNAKLDDMVESGQLQEIIAQYLDSQAVIGFEKISNLKAATNLVEGSICNTLGAEQKFDGLGAFYTVRELTIYDVIDDFEIVSLTNYPSLVAERIHNIEVDTNRDNITLINSKQVVILGDSYGMLTNNWVSTFVSLNNLTLGTDCYNFCTGNSGLIGGDPTNTYLTNLQDNESSIANKSLIKSFIICGGWNDRTKNAADLETAMSTLVTYIKANYPNAEIYVGMIGNTGVVDDVSGSIHFRRWLVTQVLPGYKSVENYGGHYLQGVENVMHKYDLYSTYDYVHPNADGCVALGKAISIAYNQGYYNYCSNSMYEGIAINSTNYTLDESLNTNSQMNITGYIYNGSFNLKISGNLNFTSYPLMNAGSSIDIPITMYDANQKYFRNTDYLNQIPIRISYTTYETNSQYRVTQGLIMFNTDGSIKLRVYNVYNETRYIKTISLLNNGYTIPFICQ